MKFFTTLLKLPAGFIGKIVSVFSTKIFVLLGGLLTSVLIARFLGAEGRGIWGLVTATVGIGAQVSIFGIPNANTYYISKNWRRIPFAIGNIGIVVAFSICLVCLCFLFFRIFPKFSFIDGKFLLPSIVCIPFQVAFILLQNMDIAIGRIKDYNLFCLLNGILFPISFFLFCFFFDSSVEILLYLYLLTNAILALSHFFLLKRFLSEKIKISLLFFRRCFYFGIKSNIIGFISYLTTHMGIFIIRGLYGYAVTGTYSLAAALVECANMITASVGILFFPEAVKLTCANERRRFFTRTILITLGILTLVVLCGFAVSAPLILLLFGEEFGDSIIIFRVLLLGVLFLAPSAIWVQYFFSIRRLNTVLVIQTIGLGCNAILCLILLPLMGSIGVAFSLVNSYLVTTILYAICFYKEGITKKFFFNYDSIINHRKSC